MTPENWQAMLKAWQDVKKQAEIDLEQSEFFIQAINAHLNNREEKL